MDNHINFNGVEGIVPPHFIDSYPKFVRFVNIFFDYLYSKKYFDGNMIDLMISQGKTDEQIIKAKNQFSPGEALENIEAAKHLRRMPVRIRTKDGSEVKFDSGQRLCANKINQDMIEMWLAEYGLGNINQSNIRKNGRLAEMTRFIKLLKPIYKIAGSPAAIKLIFGLVFDGEITVFLPKTMLAIPDENFIADDADIVLRDDYYYDEFAMEVQITNHSVTYSTEDLEGFIDFYKQHFHASGFAFFTSIENYDL